MVSYQETKDFYQFNITLTKPTAQTVFTFPLETEGLEFYYQAPLNEELDAKQYDFLNSTHAIRKNQVVEYRPENVVSSYAVYKTNIGNGETGKLYHIYRPLLVDAEKKTSWANLSMSKTEMQIVCDPEFLKSAVYPVVIDPTFGYTDIGGTAGGTPRSVVSGWTTTEAFTSGKICIYLDRVWGDCDLYGFVYESNSSSMPEDLLSSVNIGAADSTGWWNGTLEYSFSDATNYFIGGLCVEYDGGMRFMYDSAAGDSYSSVDTGTVDDPFNTYQYGHSDRAYSFFIEYTTAAANHTDAELSEIIVVTSSFDSQKSLNRYSSETTTITSSTSTTKTLYRSSGSSFTVETTTATQKDLGAMFIEQFETVTITAGLYTTKHIATTLIELTETLTILANLYTDLLVELTTSDLLGLIIVFSVIALAIALCALGLHFKKK